MFLRRGFDVVADRYYPSSLVYQIIQGVSASFISAINRYCPTPDLLFMIDTSLKTRMKRTLKRRNMRPYDFFLTPRAMKEEQILYAKLMRKWANRPYVRILFGSKSKEQLSEDVLNLTLSIGRTGDR
jgi:thymidylate kinase